MSMENAPQRLLVEALGTFALCFMGCGAIIMTQGGNIVAIALAHALAIAVMVTAVGHISGGHFNPAVTLGMLVSGRTDVPSAIAYIVAQLVGAVAGAGALTLIYLDIDRNRVNLGLPAVGQTLTTDPIRSLSTGNALAMEIIGTFFLVLVIFGVAVDRRTGGRAVAGLAIGLTIAMGIFAGGAVSGAAFNPSRWFGPALVQQDFANFWIWIVGPIAGALLAALVYSLFLMRAEVAADEATKFEDIAQAVEEAQESAPPRRRQSRRRR